MLIPSQALDLVRQGRFHELREAGLTPHFSWGEAFVNVHDERLLDAEPIVFLNLFSTFQRMEVVRGIVGNRPIKVTSAWRDPQRNAAVGGARNSQHLQGNAVDFVVAGLSPQQVQGLLDPLWFGGLGYGSTFTHVDIRPQRARFNY